MVLPARKKVSSDFRPEWHGTGEDLEFRVDQGNQQYEDEEEEYEEYETAEESRPRSQTLLNVEKPSVESWREFGHDTKAGRLLKSIYSRTHNKPLPSYPKLQTKADGGPKPTWSNVQPRVFDPHANTGRRERERKVAVPKQRRRPSEDVNPRPIDLIPRRKSAEKISEEMKEIVESMQTNRPLPRKAISTEMEKRKLAIQFQFKGGKALPEVGTMKPIEGNIPLALVTGNPTKAFERRQERRRQERELQNKLEQEQLENEFDQCEAQVAELSKAIRTIEASKHHGATRRLSSLRQELQQRVTDMENIDDMIRSLKAMT